MDDSILNDFRRELDALATIRDELKLKAHLARAEFQSELDQLDRKWRLADEQLQHLKSHAKRDVSLLKREVNGALVDLKKGFQEIKRTFEES